MPDADVYLSAEYGEYTVSNNADLSSITIYSGGDEAVPPIEITGSVTEYTVTVPFQTATIQIMATALDIQAVPELDGENHLLEDINLLEGANTFNITVTSSDNTGTKHYTLIIKRAPDLSLSELKISGEDAEYIKELDKNKPTQSVAVTEREIQITAAPNNTQAEITGDVNSAFTAPAGNYITKTITVSAAAPDGEEYSQNYRVNVIYSENGEPPATAMLIVTLRYNYDKDDGVYRTIKVAVVNENGGDTTGLTEDLAEASAKIERPYYEFDGWYENASGGAEFNPAVPITTEKTLYAHWTPVEYTLKFDYNYPADDPNPKTEPQPLNVTGNCETAPVKPDNPELQHYDFKGWYTAEGALYKSYNDASTLPPLTENKTVYAKWDGITYNVIFDAGEGASPRTQTVTATYPAQAREPAYIPVKTNYGFMGWLNIQNGAFEPYTPTQDGDTFHADWEEGAMPLTLYSNNGAFLNGTIRQTKNTTFGGALSLTAEDIPSREHYTFAGWYDAPDGGTLYGGPTGIGEITGYRGDPSALYAHWTAATYTITLDVNGGNPLSPNTRTSTYPASLDLTGITPVKTGYDFTGWTHDQNGGVKYTVIDAYSGNPVQVYAQWALKQYDVKFYKNESSSDAPYLTIKVSHNSTIGAALPPLPARRAYVAKGWFNARGSGNAVTSGTTVTGNLDIYAQWLGKGDTETGNATGGTTSYVETDTGFNEVHVFTTSSTDKTFKFSSSGSREVKALIVAGGGGGGGAGSNDGGGGGGAGGLIDRVITITGNTAYSVTVGSGGSGGDGSGTKGTSPITKGNNGGDSLFAGEKAIGGGGGGKGQGTTSEESAGSTGGSGGGGGAASAAIQGNAGFGTWGQGYNGGKGSSGTAGGGGGGSGGDGNSSGNGGSGRMFNYTGSNVTYAVGGPGAENVSSASTTPGSGGKGGAQTGNGGSAGQAGVVIISFPYKP
jgi:uncharacterized repeat protein (TIGR02543 family)